MDTAGIRQTLVTERTLPAVVTPAKHTTRKIITFYSYVTVIQTVLGVEVVLILLLVVGVVLVLISQFSFGILKGCLAKSSVPHS